MCSLSGVEERAPTPTFRRQWCRGIWRRRRGNGWWWSSRDETEAVIFSIITPPRWSSVIVLVVRSFCLFVCEQDYCKSNQPISVKLGVKIRPTSGKNLLTFGGDPVTDSQSLFYIHHHCRIRDFQRFISISHTVTSRFSWHSVKWLMFTS